ncbi:hypothetical protein Back11_34970 [Paenibacillus baekrokdamisoli]|uniref:Uncharacterized protein n=1 Tax=Paenibacillus baekrokdamisoli TaxID=1712516 RepID=A0A3G9IV82_9BACL|nr:hypothetical protein [Paenibacillus baekrokdamisoli]MBB3070909.1 hypothetical protein [Paenibacillus baekrokdamisoli]BBH22152.1 hypothetical protein Back11_34970 [Paenibacillus baekrokdamisoli]
MTQVKKIVVLSLESMAGTELQMKYGSLIQQETKAASRLEATIEGSFKPGSGSAIVTVKAPNYSFSFFVRDIHAKYPVYLPEYGVIVTDGEDTRTYREIEDSILSLRKLKTLEKVKLEPETSYEGVSPHTKDLHFQTWLGLSRDFRIFTVDFHESLNSVLFDYVEPRFHLPLTTIPETDNAPVRYSFRIGRGVAPKKIQRRRLEDGVLPILHGVVDDGDIVYNTTTFVTLERSDLTKEHVRGTHYLVADGHTSGQMFTPSQKEEYDRLLPIEMDQEEETVIYYRVEAINTADVPRYCWLFAPLPNGRSCPTNEVNHLTYQFDSETGFGVYGSGRVYGIVTINGEPLQDQEMAILIQPGEKLVLDMKIPHRPISRERAQALAAIDFAEKHAQCRAYWLDKLDQASSYRLPEKRLDEMVRAGLLHLDISTYGLEPAGTLAPTIGVYAPIGSESAPIIQFMDSMGWHDTARRSIMFFLDKQHDNGFIQNFQEYMLETGCVLWTIGEHYRYTRNEAWIAEVKPKIVKACQYILEWRERNKKEELRSIGYGMLDGKTADPEDPFRSFMLNGYAYVGLKRIAEVFAEIDAAYAAYLAEEAEAFKADIRQCFFERLALSPVVPLGDGTWCPTAPPWAEAIGPVALFADQGEWYTHGTYLCRDSLLGPLYLVFTEVIDPNEPAAQYILDFHAELMLMDNVAFSQPYYSRHPWVHLKRSEVNAFLKGYYTCFSALADRETYTFGEHLFAQTSPHKTHEEGWFLMETRWMLYMEERNTLKLLPGIPRRWMNDGESIQLDRAASYFGPFSLKTESDLQHGVIRARITFHENRLPGAVEVRLPHPLGRKPSRVTGGTYLAETEAVLVDSVASTVDVEMYF